MTNLCLVFISLGAVLEVSFAGSIGIHENRDQFDTLIGSANDKCSVLSGLLPDPKSGCCGRHSKQEANIKDAEKNVDSHDEIGNNEVSPGNADSELGGDYLNDVKKINSTRSGAKCIDVGGIVNNVINNVLDNVRDRITTWISKFSDEEAQSSRKSGPSYIMPLTHEKNTSNEITDDYKSNSPGLSEDKQTGLRHYPWLLHVTIDIDDTRVTTCEGSLISPRFVITAADCVNKAYKSLDDIKIYLAESSSDCTGGTCVENVIMHPDKIIIHEDFEFKLNGLFNDIALMRLKGSAPYTEYIRPICLPPFNIDVPKNEGALLETAGSTSRAESPIKQTGQAKLVSQTQCKKDYSQLAPGQICAVGHTEQETCQDNSGGPLMVENDGSFYLVGVTSGKGTLWSCGSSKPGLYSNVFAYTKWIVDNMNV